MKDGVGRREVGSAGGDSIKSMGSIAFLNISSDVLGFLIFHHNYSTHLIV